jgi:hypothetical protein
MSPGLTSASAGRWPSPLPVARQQDDVSIRLPWSIDARVNFKRQDARNESMHIIAGTVCHGPVGMHVVFQRGAGGEYVFKMAPPTAAALVYGDAIFNGTVSGPLQVEIEGGVDAQAGFMHLFRAETLVEFLPHFILEPRSNQAFRLGDVEAKGCTAGFLGLDVGDYAI